MGLYEPEIFFDIVQAQTTAEPANYNPGPKFQACTSQVFFFFGGGGGGLVRALEVELYGCTCIS